MIFCSFLDFLTNSEIQITLPKIVETYFDDFGKTKGEVISWITRYLQPEVAETVRESFSIRFDAFHWDFSLKFALAPPEPILSAPKTMEEKEKSKEMNLNNSMNGNPAPSPPIGCVTSSSYGNSLKSFLGIIKKEEQNLTAVESPSAEEKKRTSAIFGSKRSADDVRRNSKMAVKQSSFEELPSLPHSHPQAQAVLLPKPEKFHVNRPADLELKLKQSHDTKGHHISYFLVRMDSMGGRFLQYGLVDEKDGKNWVGTIGQNAKVQISPFQWGNASDSEIIEYTGPIRTNGVATNRCVACFSDGRIQVTENEKTIWEVKVDSELSSMGTICNLVEDDPSNDHIVCVAWDGTTHILDQEREIVRFKMEDKVTTFACGSYSIHSGKSSPAFVYVTHTDEIVMFYGADHMISSMKTTNLINLMQNNMTGYELLKQDPTTGLNYHFLG